MHVSPRLLFREIVSGLKASFWGIPLLMVAASLLIAPDAIDQQLRSLWQADA